jgi:hypothetical protein
LDNIFEDATDSLEFFSFFVISLGAEESAVEIQQKFLEIFVEEDLICILYEKSDETDKDCSFVDFLDSRQERFQRLNHLQSSIILV